MVLTGLRAVDADSRWPLPIPGRASRIVVDQLLTQALEGPAPQAGDLHL